VLEELGLPQADGRRPGAFHGVSLRELKGRCGRKRKRDWTPTTTSALLEACGNFEENARHIIGGLARFSNDQWSPDAHGTKTFPYIEISGVDTLLAN